MFGFGFGPEFELLAEMGVAAVLGGLIGLERESANKPAGFRTHLLVAGASAFLLGLGEVLVFHFQDTADDSLIRTDPIRVLEGIIMGVSFLGAGTIFRHADKDYVEGITTGASLLFAAAIGICVSLHYFITAVGATVFVLLALLASHFESSSKEKKKTNIEAES